mgnify:CR=1 FL=1
MALQQREHVETSSDIFIDDEQTHVAHQSSSSKVITSIEKMKKGVMLINTARGALMEPKALVKGLKSKQIGYLGLDVYEKEATLFFEDHSCDIIQDDIFERLLTFPNVLITGHQAYFTQEAIEQIAKTTADQILAYQTQQPLDNVVVLRSNVIT